MDILVRFAAWTNRLCQRVARLGSVAVSLLLVLCLIELASKGLHPQGGASIGDVRACILAAMTLIFLPHLLAENREAGRAHLLGLSDAARARLRLAALILLVLPACLSILAVSTSAALDVLGLLFMDCLALPFAWSLRLVIPIGFLLATLQALVEVMKALGIDPE